MRKKGFFKTMLLSVMLMGAGSVITYAVMKDGDNKDAVYEYSHKESEDGFATNVMNDNRLGFKGAQPQGYMDFTYAAEHSVDAVVYVKVTKRSDRQQAPSSLLEYFFGFGGSMPREQIGTGSGVIISEDGFIVTNNHVVSGASEIEVTVGDNKTFKAEIVGADPATDVALLKVEAKGLPTIPYGNSDQLRLGEWVLAIGSPYGLTSTITAGIVSAKGRSMPNYTREFKIESFIQTDAAVNPGNSGGALVNVKGELVGINTMIVSQTGSYAGYSFAVPVNIVKKIVEDFKEYGSVQRAMLGISMLNNSEDFKEEMKLFTSKGVFIAEVTKGGAAEKAGLEAEDILLSIDGQEVNKSTTVQEIIGAHRPGDKVELEVLRGEKKMTFKVILIGRNEQEMNAYNAKGTVNLFGAQLVPAPKAELEKLGLQNGVKVMSIDNGKMKDAGIKEGFIITYINNTQVSTPQDVAAEIKKSKRSILIEGFDVGGNLCYYGIGL